MLFRGINKEHRDFVLLPEIETERVLWGTAVETTCLTTIYLPMIARVTVLPQMSMENDEKTPYQEQI